MPHPDRLGDLPQGTTSYDIGDSDQAGIRDTPVLEEYHRRLAELDACALWTLGFEVEPKPKSVPVLWRYAELRPLVRKALELVDPDGPDGGRRTVVLINPGHKDIAAAVGLLCTGLQIVGPGEATHAHRHQNAALRYVHEGTGAWTIVDGQKLEVGSRDFVINPSGPWHEHGIDSGEEPVIWQDYLDIPLVDVLDAAFVENHPERHQIPGKVVNSSLLAYSANLLPYGLEKWTKPYSPVFGYLWDATYEALLNLAKASEGSPFDGVIMEYVNPLTGGPLMPTMGAHIQLLRPGQATRAHRHTGSVICTVTKGRGASVIAGRRFPWQDGDTFCVPSWAWHEHSNLGQSEDACLLSVSDFPVMRSLCLDREEAYPGNGGHQTAP